MRLGILNIFIPRDAKSGKVPEVFLNENTKGTQFLLSKEEVDKAIGKNPIYRADTEIVLASILTSLEKKTSTKYAQTFQSKNLALIILDTRLS